MLDIYPDKLITFKQNRNRDFCLIVTPALAKKINIHSSKYKKVEKIICGFDEKIDDVVINRVSSEADIIFIPYQYNKLDSFPKKSSLKKKQRFLNMMAASQVTPITLNQLKHFLPLLHSLNPEKLKNKVDHFFDKISYSTTVSFINKKYGTQADLILNDQDLWSEVCGVLAPGETGVIPYGELALTPPNFEDLDANPLALNGDIILHGHPILHTIGMNEKLRKEQENLFRKIYSLNNGAIKLKVAKGIIEDIHLIDQSARAAYDVIKALFSQDTNYKIFTEIGFGLNDELVLVDSNCAMNETYGGENICIHFGIGRAPITRYHLDVICPSTEMMTNDKSIIIKPQKFQRKPAQTCPCNNRVKDAR